MWIIAYSAAGTFVILLICKFTTGLRVTEEQEEEGLDNHLHGEALDEVVGLFAEHAGGDEGEHDALRIDEAVAHGHRAEHVLGVDEQAADDEVDALEHVVEQRRAVRDDDALGGGMRDVALVPQRDVLEGGHGVAA